MRKDCAGIEVKMRLNELRRLIASEFKKNSNVTPQSIIRRLNEDASNVDHEENGVSLDAQVDRYLSTYEKEAKTVKSEGNNTYRIFRSLMEADDGESESNDAEETDVAPTVKLSIDDIDVETYVNNVARLIENYDNLLEVRDTLIKRSINFISKNYDIDVVKAVKDGFKNEHSMIAGKSEGEHEAEDFQAPRAAEAGPL